MKYVESAKEHLEKCEKFAPECFQCQIAKLAMGLLSGKYSEKKLAEKVIHDEMTEEEKAAALAKDEYYQDGVRPAIFKHLVGKGHPEF